MLIPSTLFFPVSVSLRVISLSFTPNSHRDLLTRPTLIDIVINPHCRYTENTSPVDMSVQISPDSHLGFERELIRDSL